MTKFLKLTFLAIFLILASLTFPTQAKKSKERKSVAPRPHPTVLIPPEEGFFHINFTDYSTRRVTVTAVFVKPCILTRTVEGKGACGLIIGEEAFIDVRFQVKGQQQHNLGNPKLTQCAQIDQFGFRNTCFPFPLGKYSEPCKIPEDSKLTCPVLPTTNDDGVHVKEHRLMAGITLPKFTPGGTSLDSFWTLEGEKGYRRAHLKLSIPLETVK